MDDDIYRKYPGELPELWTRILESYPDDQKLIWYDKLLKRHLIYSHLMAAHNISPRGLVYLGANTGQLLWTWILLGFKNIVMVEPQPDKFRILEHLTGLARGVLEARDRFSGPAFVPRLHTRQCAVTDKDGAAPLYIMSNSNLTSLLPPNEALIREQTEHVVSGIKLSEEIEVPTCTLDSLIHDLPDSTPEEFEFLYMNIQGSELNALKGAPENLKNLRFILLEINYSERYFGCPSEKAIHEYLAKAQFQPVWGHKSNDSGFVAYARKQAD